MRSIKGVAVERTGAPIQFAESSHAGTGASEAPRRTKPAPQATTDAAALALIVLVAGAYLWRLGAAPLMDPIEAHHATIPQEMLARGDWITPYLNDARYLDKPPLVYWLGALIYRVAGVSNGSARLMAGLPMLLQLACVYLAGRWAFGARTGFVALAVFASMVSSFLFARVLLADTLFSCCLTLALMLWTKALAGQRTSTGWYLAGFLGVALAAMTKSLVGIALPLAGLGAYHLLQGDLRSHLRRIGTGLALVAAVAAPWHLAVAARHPGFWSFYILNEQVLRFFDLRIPHDYTATPIWVFLPIVVALAFPWATLVPSAMFHAWRVRGRLAANGPGLLFACWIVVVLGFFLCTSGRQYVYALPCYPPLAILLGMYFTDLDAGTANPRARGLQAGLLALALVLGAGIVAVPVLIREFSDTYDLRSLDLPARIASLVGFLLICAAIVAQRSRRIGACVAAVSLTTIAMLPVVGEGLHVARASRTSEKLGRQLADRAGTNDMVVMQFPPDNEYENVAGLRFYYGHKVWLVRLPSTPALYLPPPPEEDFFISVPDLAARWSSSEPVFLVGEEDFIRSLPLPHVCWGVEDGDHWLVSNIESLPQAGRPSRRRARGLDCLEPS